MKRARSPRMRKIDELLREVLAEQVVVLKDPRIGFVTVTGVETSPDLRRATVFYSVLGSEEEAEATAEALRHAAPHLQAKLARQVRLKFTPVLSFEIDPAIERGARLTRLFHELETETHDAETIAHDTNDTNTGESEAGQ